VEELKAESEHTLDPEQEASLKLMLDSLTSGGSGSSLEVTQDTLTLLQRLLLWPDAKVFPVIDLAKKLALAPSMAAQNSVMLERLLNRVLEIGERMALKQPNGTYTAPEKVRYANTRLTLEFATNMLSAGCARSVLQRLLPRVLAVAAEGCTKENKTEKRAALAAMLNSSIAFFLEGGGGEELGELKTGCLVALNEYLQAEVHRCLTAGHFASDPAALDSCLGCLGNLLQDASTRPMAVSTGIIENLGRFLPMLSPPQSGNVAHLQSLVSS